MKIKLSDYITKFLEKKNIKHVFGITGGGAMHLNDSFGRSSKMSFVFFHHEQAASMAAVILSAGTKGKRSALKNSRIMIHQPLGGVQGQATDIEIHTKEILFLKERLNTILSKNTGKTTKTIEKDTNRDNFMSSKEAINYGIIDQIVTGDK